MNLKDITKNLKPITTTEIFIGKGVNLHPDGLFSETIFGQMDDPIRKKTFSYIELNSKVMHPALFSVIRRLNKGILLAMSGEKSFSLDSENYLVLDEEGDIKGMSSVINNFSKINFREDTKMRTDMINMVKSYSKKNMVFIDKLVVIPAGSRDIQLDERGEHIQDAINDYYLKILKLSIQIQSIQEGPVFDVLSYQLNEYVLELYDYITKKLSKKEGLIRGNILGKRVDFTTRAVITGNAIDLKPDEIGVPFSLLVKIFEPFIMYEILNSKETNRDDLLEAMKEHDIQDLSAPNIRALLLGVYKGDEIPETLQNMLIDITNRAIKDKVVIAKRDPVLHAENVQAFKPILVMGNSIQLNAIKCASYGADFDGDQMALFVPVTNEAIQQAKEKLIISISKDSINKMGDSINKDLSTGIYVLTKNSKSKGYKQLKDLTDIEQRNIYDTVSYNGNKTTIGRVIFNQCFPKKVKFINKEVKEDDITKLVQFIYDNFDREIYNDFMHCVSKTAAKYYTIAGPTFGINDLEIPQSILKLKKQLENADPEEAQKLLNQMTTLLLDHINKTDKNLAALINGGGGSRMMNSLRQIMVAKGLVADSKGNILPVFKNSYTDGLSDREFFDSGQSARKGIMDRVLNTAPTGYLARQLVFVLQRVEADPSIKDCGTKRYFNLKAIPDIAKRLEGRFIVDGNKLVLFSNEKYRNKLIELRSPIYCLSSRICLTCYGNLLLRNNTQYVGIVAAEILGERGTQVSMKTFHTGGAIEIKSLNILSILNKNIEEILMGYVRKNFKQSDSDFFSISKPVNLEISFKDYLNPKTDIIFDKENNLIQLKYIYGLLRIEDKVIDFSIDNPVTIKLIQGNYKVDDLKIIINYKPKEIIFSVSVSTDIFSDTFKSLSNLLSGKKPWKNADHLTLKLYEQYKDLNMDADLVHIEICASNLLRDKGNPSYPARLNKKYNPEMVSLKSIPGHESWLTSMAFEDFNKSVVNGLTYERPKESSVLEQLITGEF